MRDGVTEATAWRLVCTIVSASVLLGCGSSLPARGVLERDLGDFAYRRYQKVLDVEVNIEGNPAVGHTATYVRRDRGRAVAFTTAFVTVYERAAGVAEEVREALSELSTYERTVQRESGNHVHRLVGNGEAWALWVSDRYLVKVGAPTGEDFPDDVLSAYLDLYPSDLDELGKARAGTASVGASRAQRAEATDDGTSIQREGTTRGAH